MKKWIWILLSAMLLPTVSCTTSGKKQDKQEESKHMLFKGVPIDGTLQEFVQEMESIGFSLEEEEQGAALLKGDFAGSKGVMVTVWALQPRDLVNTIIVGFPPSERNSWEAFFRDYATLKAELVKKYGKPTFCKEEERAKELGIENIDSLYYPNPHDFMQSGLSTKDFVTQFETDKGVVRLFFHNASSNGMVFASDTYVALQYWDKINTELVKQDAINDL